MGKMSRTSCRALSTPGKFSNVDRYELMDTDSEEYIPNVEREEQLNQSIPGLGVSPCKVTTLRQRDKINYAKRKVKQVKEISKTISKEIAFWVETPPNCRGTAADEIDRHVSGSYWLCEGCDLRGEVCPLEG